MGELVSGPYFSFSRDGEVYERESSSGHILESSHPRSQSSSTIHRPSGPTVILHDPGTELAQRKVLPRRVSHKDKILSMISDKHKRAVEKQTKMIRDEQSTKPVPPMILLSQSTAPEPEDDDQTSSIDLGLYSQENGSYESEKHSEKDVVGESKDISEANTTKHSLNPHTTTVVATHSTLATDDGDSRRFEHERKTSFGDESRRTGRTLASTLSSASCRLGVSPSSSPGSRDARAPSHDWRAPLLEDHEEVDEDEREDESDARDETLGPELYLAKTEQSQAFGSIPGSWSGSGSDFDGQRSEARRSSLGRMAAAFVSQPGSFSISTAPASPPLAPGGTVERDAQSIQVPTLTFTAQDAVDRPQGLQPTQGVTKHSVTAPSLSPSGPPSFLPAQPVGKRAHGRTASAGIMERPPRSQRPPLRTQSTQSLKEIQQKQQGRLAPPESANSFSLRLTPPSPSLLPNAQFEATTVQSEEAREGIAPLASPAAQPSPQPRTTPLHHRTSFNGRNNHRHSVVAPFQGGNNYSIPGFSPQPQTSPQHPPSPGSNSAVDQTLTSAQGLGSSWFNLRHHSRNPSRSTMTSIGIPYSAGSMPPSPFLTPSELVTGGGLGIGLGAGIVDPGKRSEEYFHDATTTTSGSMTMAPQHTTTTTAGAVSAGTTVAEVSGVAEFERVEGRLHESNFHLPLYSTGGGLGFDARWSLRAIPDWFPVSSTKVAWTSLTILVLAIGSTIVYDFIQLARGADPVGGS
ncbi:hypothetical protein BGX24_012352 [Mortierella sp. AD032]|nr:hypothetical protein BGX24_012352 [Mortierella sp. AD032]